MRAEFKVHLLNARGKAVANSIAEAFSDLADELEEYVPPLGRYASLVRTKLEEASYFAKRASAEESVNQEVE